MGISGWLLTGMASLTGAVLFIPRELWRRWRERLVERLDRMLRRQVSRFDRRYREFVLQGLQFVDLKGLATVGFHTPELDEVYVDVSLAHRAPHQVPTGLLDHAPADLPGRRSIGDFLDLEQPAVLAVIGGPGTGKTTLLRHTARVVCRARRNRRRAVPILLYLRDHVEAIVTTPTVSLPTLVRGTLGRYAADEPPDWFEQRLEAGDCVVLLDGLDEVARQEDRRRVADWVEHLREQYPANDYVITSRPQGYRAASVASAAVLEVRSFTGEQVTTFVRAWYRAVARRNPDAVPDGADDDLLRRLDRTPGLSALTVNPLLLTMIANVHHYRGALPGSRAELYGEICQVMLWRRQEAKKLPSELGGDKKELLLRGLAFAMMQRRVRDLPRTEALAEFGRVLRRMSAQVDAEQFLDEVCAYGLLIERESGLYAFAHLTFQESLAADHIRGRNLVDLLTKTVDDPWWRECTLLYVAQSDADPIVAACLADGTVNALSLALDCADQSGGLEPELRTRLDEVVAASEAGLQVALEIARQFSAVIRTSEGGQVSARPITSDLYERFRTASGTGPPDGPAVSPAEPVVGVRASDATAFVRWVNEVIGTSRYRLATVTELAEPGVERMLAATADLRPWATSGGAAVLWTPPGTRHPNLIDAETFARHLDEDLERLAPALARILLFRSVHEIHDKNADSNSVELIADNFADFGQRPRYMMRPVWLANTLAQKEHPVLVGEALSMARDLGLDQVEPDLTTVFALWRTLPAQLSDVRRRGDTVGHDQLMSNAFDVVNNPQSVSDTKDELREAVSKVQETLRRLSAELPSGEVPARALSEPLDTAYQGRKEWRDEFRPDFDRMVRVAECAGVVSVDDLADHVRTGAAAVVEAMPTQWAHAVTRRLIDNALPVLERREALRPLTASAIRLAALCLAAEADTRCPEPVGDNLRAVATGITLLERRATEQVSATEAIILATE